MSSARRFQCTNCNHEIVAWSDYDNYFINTEGKKQYAYHPDHDALENCIGYDVPFLCIDCGEPFSIDSSKPHKNCPICNSNEICELYDIEQKNCPYCRSGKFLIDNRFYRVS